MKKCTACLKRRKSSNFYKEGRGLKSECKKCNRKTSLAYYYKHQKESRNYQLLVNYGITLIQLNKMYKKRKGKCDICRKKLELSVTGSRGLVLDHAKTDKTVRGLLCGNCNTSIGKLGDTYEGVLRALRYLEPFR